MEIRLSNQHGEGDGVIGRLVRIPPSREFPEPMEYISVPWVTLRGLIRDAMPFSEDATYLVGETCSGGAIILIRDGDEIFALCDPSTGRAHRTTVDVAKMERARWMMGDHPRDGDGLSYPYQYSRRRPAVECLWVENETLSAIYEKPADGDWTEIPFPPPLDEYVREYAESAALEASMGDD